MYLAQQKLFVLWWRTVCSYYVSHFDRHVTYYTSHMLYICTFFLYILALAWLVTCLHLSTVLSLATIAFL
jgi:hypothetical protein